MLFDSGRSRLRPGGWEGRPIGAMFMSLCAARRRGAWGDVEMQWKNFLIAAAFALAAAAGAGGAADGGQGADAGPAAAKTDAAEAAGNHFVHKGLVIDFQVEPVGAAAKSKELMTHQLSEVRFRITEEATGNPLRGANPGAWMDMSAVIQGKPGEQQKSCKDKVSLYMQGAVGIRPMIDLNSYFVVVMNAEPSLSIVDPLVSMAGKTSTLAQINLPAPGADWATTADQKRLYVSAPRAGKVVVVDAETFKVARQIDAGKEPIRVALQPDGKYLWTGNDAKEKEQSGVTVIDTESDKVVANIPTGRGHHELAFSADSRHAFVSNREDGTVSVIDTAGRKRIKDIKTGALPISLAYSSQAGAVYVADGKDGTVSVIDAGTLQQGAKIKLSPGLGPLRFEQTGRYALVVNPGQDTVSVIDASSNELVNTIAIKGEPYQIAFSKTFAYVRALRSEHVSMITLASLGKGNKPAVQSFTAGAEPPRAGGQLAVADAMTAASKEGTFFVVNPADNTTYYYMEGMNAASSNYRVKGGSARAVTLLDRSLKEVEPGVYAGKVTLPAAGRYDVAFLMQSPQVLHCFSAEAKANPAATPVSERLAVEFDEKQRTVNAGETLKLRFRLIDPATGQARTGVQDARIMYFLAPGRLRSEVAVKELGNGQYEAELPIRSAGAYYIHLGVPSLKVSFDRLPYFSVRAVEKGAPEPGADKKG